ncbi:MarR family transcriptional regulator [Amycolatopsis umgeniensis]|uniref:DNA-binding MarR family transcriptional regulator n=1 Tax=Amycolatopsis umgeniensis TaxID=336628 RepID=A0A841AXT1_9PSEU|nr:MarR family transcriptional regulator [Amycolatopsis umgeniensis]MBB5851195.1 DNA-binding MarR family transcriptional regulator [Amycolatopsis umgeniensis]
MPALATTPAGTSPAPESTAEDAEGVARGLDAWASKLKEETGEGKVLGDHAAVDRWAAAVGRWLVDATLLADIPSLRSALRAFQEAGMRLQPGGHTMRLEAVVTSLAEVAQAALDRAEQATLADTLDPKSWAAKMLLLAHREPHITSSDVCSRLGVHEAQISRSGKMLMERGLVVKTRLGRSKGWYATPRGEAVAKQLADRGNE